MCVIIHQPKDSRQVTYDEFESSWQTNPHGFGMMYFNKNRWIVSIEKSMKMKDAWEKYNNIFNEFEWETDFVLHFRYSTHWSVGLSNTHPFPCGNGKYLVHNWVLGYMSDKQWEEDYSDTRLLAKTLESFDKESHDNWLENPVVCDFIQSICTWDKILVMDKDGGVWAFGAKWVSSPDGKLWASNGSPFDYSNYLLTEWDGYSKEEGFFEDGVWVTNQEYCERNGIQYKASEWV